MERNKDVEQIVDDAIKPVLGISIGELNKDISEKLNRGTLLPDIDTSLKYKEAKIKFKQQFLARMLRTCYGNISEVAKKTGVDRRSIHRIVKDSGLDVGKIREEMIKPYQVRQKAVEGIIESVLENYKQVIHPQRIAEVYKKVDTVSKDIVDDLPTDNITLKHAEEEFEREYLRRALARNGRDISKTAKDIDIRYETLIRKIKALNI